MDKVITILEIIGTVAFSISGSLTAVKVGFDLFGIIALGVVTATAGGVLRDVILGTFPPTAFVRPVYVLAAAVTAFVIFLIVRFSKHSETRLATERFRLWLLLGDSIGLGVFTVLGMSEAVSLYSADNGFLCIFSGVVTGVGGGVLRDMMIHSLPDIFVKHIYALASIIGAGAALVFFRYDMAYIAVPAGALVTIAVRLLAAHYRWSLPHAHKQG